MSMFHELMMKKRGMPSRYQEVEYIESTGTQYIDTGIAPTNTTGLKCVVSGSSFTGDTNFLGARIQNGERFIINYINGNWGFGFNTFINTNIPADQSIINEFSLNFKNSRKFSANESEYNITSTITGAIPTIYFFAQHTSTGYTTYSYKLHSCQISEGTSIIRNFIPVYDTETQKYGMWESVQGKFYGNDGTGDFGGSIVGYTVVGSPTIIDGVVSGFATSDYLRTSKLPILSEDFEMQFKIRINDTSTSNALLGWVSGGYANYFSFSTSGKIQISFRVSSSVYYNNNGNFVFSTNTDYWVKYSKKGNAFYLHYSTDGVNWFLDNSTTFEEIISFSISNYFRIGVNGFNNPSSYFNGSIDLNETYIKINNKLWFNGQQS